MKNFVQKGETVTLTAPANVNSGDVVIVGSIIGVASISASSGSDVEVVTRGIFDLPKLTPLAIAQGTKVYWDATAKNVTNISTGNSLLGAATIAALSAATIARVRLNGVTL
jgi:predicted RecA/RadA family phage recombinase